MTISKKTALIFIDPYNFYEVPWARGQFQFNLLPLVLAHLEQLARPQLHMPGKEDFGKLRDPSVVGGDVVVEEFTAIGDAFFSSECVSAERGNSGWP